MMIEKVPMTVSGYAALEEELKRRTSEERPRIIELISEARSHGDLSENAEYHAAKEAQSHNEGRIAELEDQLSRAEVIDVSKLSGKSVIFGATVYELYKARALLDGDDLGIFAVGFIFAFLSAFLCVRWLLRFVATHDFKPFAWYRIAFGIVVLFTAYSGLVSWHA